LRDQRLGDWVGGLPCGTGGGPHSADQGGRIPALISAKKAVSFSCRAHGKLSDVLADIALLEDRSRFVAVMQGGVVKAGQLTGRGVRS
jgi:hypothetical protein